MASAEGGPRGATLMDAVTRLAPTVGIVAACDFLAVARASFYRQRPVLGPLPSPAPEPALPSERSAPARSLSEAERTAMLLVLHEDRFQDRSPAAVQATLLDEGQYLCSTRTMYRILEQEGRLGSAAINSPLPQHRLPRPPLAPGTGTFGALAASGLP